MARPVVAALGATAVLACCSPRRCRSRRRPGPTALAQFPKDSDVRVGNDLASAQLGGGSPVRSVVASFERARRAPDRRSSPVRSPNCAQRARRQRRCRAGLRRRQRLVERDLERATSDPDAATALVDRLRDSFVPASALAAAATSTSSGETARTDDVRRPGLRLVLEDRRLRPRAQLPSS